MKRMIVWVSAGAASAVAWKIAKMRYGSEYSVEGVYCDMSKDEHPDNARFLSDLEKWVGDPVIRLKHPKYESVEDVWLGERYIVGPTGASCARVMKREQREAYQRPDDKHVFGFTADEKDRIEFFKSNHPELDCAWVLLAGGITKEDCYHVLSAAGIELPMAYKLGFSNNNCLKCCKGGKGYWNKIRKHFPETFWRVAKIQREVGCMFGGGDYKFYLDELKPDEGLDVPEPPIQCGIFCGNYSTLIDLTVSKV